MTVVGLVLGAVSAVSAQEWSIGVGGLFGSNFGGGYKGGGRNLLSAPHLGGAGEVFFSSEYAEAAVGFITASGVWVDSVGGGAASSKVNTDVSTMTVNVGVWVKYPYHLAEAFKLFPIAGLDYEIYVYGLYSRTNGVTNKVEEERMVSPNNLSRLWFKGGAGADVGLSERIYIHSAVLYGVGWKNSVERNVVKADKYAVVNVSHGLTAKVGVGYMFDFD